MAETRILPVSAGRETSQGSPAPKAEKKLPVWPRGCQQTGPTCGFCLSFAILASFPATAAGKYAGCRIRKKPPISGAPQWPGPAKQDCAACRQIFPGLAKGGLRFCPAKKRAQTDAFRTARSFFSLPKTPGRKKAFSRKKNCAAQGERQACRLYLPQFHTFPGK